MTRRWLTLLQLFLLTAATVLVAGPPAEADEADRPNFLWISFEDISPDLGCYGDSYADTPLFDKLASQGVRYTHAFSHAGVCAPARSGIITGMYPTSIGTQHMRCSGVPPAAVKCFPEYLRQQGYYCTNNSKTDYQFAPPLTAWDESSNRAHWRNRQPDQPFFAVFNFTSTHESQIRSDGRQAQNRKILPPERLHDPAKAPLPPYYPDNEVSRRDWANYHDNISAVENQMQSILDQLEADGLRENTIIWIWGDHGRGLPRAKRWIYDSGIHIPLMVIVPEKYRALATAGNVDTVEPGTVTDRLVAFVDFAPTMLSLAGIKIPDHLQGQAFLGPQTAPPREFIYAHRDRMDERYDVIRAIRDQRFKYIRNFMPYKSYGQDISYMNQMPTMRTMRALHAEGKLLGPEAQYFREVKPVEELYDTQTDPHEIHNLADNPAYREQLTAMRQRLENTMREIGDVGLLPEAVFDELKRPGNKMQTTGPVVATASPQGEGATIALNCPTPGASIAYQLADAGAQPNLAKNAAWQLYASPLTVQPGQTLVAKAVRIGFRDGPTLQWLVGQPLPEPPAAGEQPRHWRKRLAELGDDPLAQLLTFKKLDLMPAETAVPKYEEALTSPLAAIRYWAVRGLQHRSPDEMNLAMLVPLLESDPSPVVRVAAAEALAARTQSAAALEVLVTLLKHPQETVRLTAINDLDELGEAARPALPAVKAALKDGNGYVVRVAENMMDELR